VSAAGGTASSPATVGQDGTEWGPASAPVFTADQIRCLHLSGAW
jgi:hypothetical protein